MVSGLPLVAVAAGCWLQPVIATVLFVDADRFGDADRYGSCVHAFVPSCVLCVFLCATLWLELDLDAGSQTTSDSGWTP
jgi:hypothetical protein